MMIPIARLRRRYMPGHERRFIRKEMWRKNYRNQAEFVSRFILGNKQNYDKNYDYFESD